MRSGGADVGLQPHRTRTFKYSRDPHLEDKVTDVVGLYMNPPENALVLCVDEKTQIQALDRTQPLLPMKPHQIERQNARLQAAWHYQPVRGPGGGERGSDRRLLPTSSP